MEEQNSEKKLTEQDKKRMESRLEMLALIGTYGQKNSQKKEFYRRRKG